MEPVLVLQTTVAILTVSAIGGLAMAFIRFAQGVNPPAWLAMLHGFLSAAAVTLLLYASLVSGLPRLANIALALFLVAAAGGATLNLNFHWKSQPLPKWLVLMHGALAVAGFLCLVAAMFAARA